MLPSSRETLWAPPGSQTSEQSQLADTRPAPTPDSHHREEGILVAAPHLFSQPKFGSGCQVPGEGGAGMARPEGRGDTGQSDWPHTRTGANPSCEWSGGQHGATGGAQKPRPEQGARTARGPLQLGCLPRSRSTLLSGARLAPTRRQPFTVLGASEDFLARPSSRPLPHRGGRSTPGTRARGFRGRWSRYGAAAGTEAGAGAGAGAGPEGGGGSGAAAGVSRPGAGARPGLGGPRGRGRLGAGPAEVRPRTLLPCPLPGEGQPPGWRKRTRPWPSSSL